MQQIITVFDVSFFILDLDNSAIKSRANFMKFKMFYRLDEDFGLLLLCHGVHTHSTRKLHLIANSLARW
jgi:hypothetical protein